VQGTTFNLILQNSATFNSFISHVVSRLCTWLRIQLITAVCKTGMYFISAAVQCCNHCIESCTVLHIICTVLRLRGESLCCCTVQDRHAHDLCCCTVVRLHLSCCTVLHFCMRWLTAWLSSTAYARNRHTCASSLQLLYSAALLHTLVDCLA
jgi:hypothetical protein